MNMHAAKLLHGRRHMHDRLLRHRNRHLDDHLHHLLLDALLVKNHGQLHLLRHDQIVLLLHDLKNHLGHLPYREGNKERSQVQGHCECRTWADAPDVYRSG